MLIKKSNTSKRYSDAEKLELIHAFNSSGMSMDQFARINGMGHSTLSRWLFNFAELTSVTDKALMKNSKNNGSFKSKQELVLEDKIRNLEKALEHEKLRSLAYSTMIDVAEEHFGIEIRKKPGAKQ